ncbi:hypothetical protein [Halalkalibacter urbisdiaboli]|uniref:hypothetical protein n=1 Tax=Halalkalibacter urbisdiaboli TaxID=1960589 RepID=UPI000B4306C2|nr:hypothetical protein [Halalkalibacter urbisdiaboli]
MNRKNQGPQLHREFLSEYAKLAQDAISTVEVDSLSIDNSEKDWKTYEQQLLTYFNLRYISDPVIPFKKLHEFVGIYRNDQMNINVNIEIKDEHLYIFGNRKLKPRSRDVFYIDDISVEVTFIKDNGKYNNLIIGEKDIFVNKNEEGTEFVRIA